MRAIRAAHVKSGRAHHSETLAILMKALCNYIVGQQQAGVPVPVQVPVPVLAGTEAASVGMASSRHTVSRSLSSSSSSQQVYRRNTRVYHQVPSLYANQPQTAAPFLPHVC